MFPSEGTDQIPSKEPHIRIIADCYYTSRDSSKLTRLEGGEAVGFVVQLSSHGAREAGEGPQVHASLPVRPAARHRTVNQKGPQRLRVLGRADQRAIAFR